MSEFKNRADLRNNQIKKLLSILEVQRDVTLDEIAFKKGQSVILEQLIKKCYEMILDVNKEEQSNELTEIAKSIEQKELSTYVPNQRPAKEKLDEAFKGIKTPKVKRRRH